MKMKEFGRRGRGCVPGTPLDHQCKLSTFLSSGSKNWNEAQTEVTVNLCVHLSTFGAAVIERVLH